MTLPTPPRRTPEERNQLIDPYLTLPEALVYSLYGRNHCGDPNFLDELIQVGSLALIEAGDRYTEDRTLPFSSYARYWIRKELRDFAINSRRPTRLPRGKFKDRAKDNEAYSVELDQYLYALTDEEQKTPEEELIEKEHLQLLKKYLPELTSIEQRVLIDYFGLEDIPPMSFRKMAENYPISHQRIQHIHSRALTKLRKLFTSTGIDEIE